MHVKLKVYGHLQAKGEERAGKSIQSQNQQNDLRAQRRLGSAWASAQSDQSLRCPHEETLGPWLSLERTAKTLIRLDGCPD